MSQADPELRSSRFLVGWSALLLVAGGLSLAMAALWLMGAAEDSELTFIMLIGLSLYASALLLIPYRRRIAWAWWVTWAYAAALASVALFTDPEIGVWYLVVAGGVAVAQLLTRSGIESWSSTELPSQPQEFATLATVGWWVLVVYAAAGLVHGIVGLFAYAGDEQVAFVSIAVINLYALSILTSAYSHGERWAWWATWILVGVYVPVVAYTEADVGPWYVAASVVLALAQLLTAGQFMSHRDAGLVTPVR